jgi:glutathione S-transferase
MKLYDNKQAPNPRRARIFMAEKGVLDEVEIVQLDLAKGEQLSGEFRVKNPFRRVPVLELDDGSCIAESVAICRYFEETVPEPPLMGGAGDAREKALVEMWQRRMEINLFLQVGMAFRNLSGFFAQYEAVNEDWGKICLENASKMFHILNKHLADNEYVCGGDFTIADITALCAVDFARTVKLRIGEEQTNLKRWHDAVSARPSARA